MTSFSVDTSDKGTQVVTRGDEAGQGPLQQVAATAVATQAPAAAPEPPPSIEQLIASTETEAGVPIDSYLGISTKEEAAVVAANAAAPLTPADIKPESPAPDAGIDPIQTASLLPLSDPGAGASAQKGRLPGLMPLAERQCRSSLREMGVSFSDVEEIANGSHCGIAYPVKLQSLSGKIAVSPNVTVNCQTALAFAEWVQNDVAPAARVRYLTGLKSVNTMGGYSCRRMNNGTGTRAWSEHSQGNAIDVGGFTLNTGKTIDVSSKSFFAFREKGLLKTVRASGCDYFNTVLGPGYPKHDDHLHFDLMQRNSDRSYCK
ncbi:extensin-like domain-containing protein [Martelella soudanensis]|uniref:extensin-like domain-containing protein n=1 Tax=unclassified Martelella TaxID=2629616 RepID=UPI0015DDC8F5|nr:MULTISPECIES: extensin family protein [unclassified Martelella]